MNDIKQLKKTHHLDRDYYPHSQKGQKMLIGMIKHFFIILLTGVIGVTMFSIAGNIENVRQLTPEEIAEKQAEIDQAQKEKAEQEKLVEEQGYDPNAPLWAEHLVYNFTGIDLTGGQLSSNSGQSDEELTANAEEKSLMLTILKRTLDIGGRVLLTLTLISLIVFTFRFIQYFKNVLQRQRFHERNVVINDLRSDLFRRRFLNSVGLRDRYNDFKDAQRKKDGRPSTDDRNKKQMFKTLLKTKFYINTRTSLEKSGMVDTQYRIYIDVENLNKEQLDLVKKEVEPWGYEATRLMRGNITFSSLFLPKSQAYIIFRAWSQKEDKYAVSDYVENEVGEVVVYQSVYPTTLIPDMQAKIDEVKENAEEWVKSTHRTVTSILVSSSKQLAELEDETQLSSNMARFLYEIPESTNLPDITSIPKSIESSIGDEGVSATVVGGNKLEILVPLPKDYQSGINVPTLLRDVFGAGEVMKGDRLVNEDEILKKYGRQ